MFLNMHFVVFRKFCVHNACHISLLFHIPVVFRFYITCPKFGITVLVLSRQNDQVFPMEMHDCSGHSTSLISANWIAAVSTFSQPPHPTSDASVLNCTVLQSMKCSFFPRILHVSDRAEHSIKWVMLWSSIKNSLWYDPNDHMLCSYFLRLLRYVISFE